MCRLQKENAYKTRISWEGGMREEKFPGGQRTWELGKIQVMENKSSRFESIMEACGVEQANGLAPPRIQSGVWDMWDSRWGMLGEY